MAKDRIFYRCPSIPCRGSILMELDEKNDIIAICDDCGVSLDGWHDHENFMFPEI